MLPKAVEEQGRLAEDLHRQAYGAKAPEEEVAGEVAEPAPEPKAPEPSDGLQQKLDALQHRFDVLQGKYNAEMPRLAAENRDLKAKLDAAKTPAAPPPGIKPEEEAEYGEGFVDFVKRAAATVVPQDIGSMKEQLATIRQEQERLTKDRFFKDLSEKAPHWESLNEDKGFLNYLAEIDPYSGRVRQDLFDEASSSFDAWRVANFFNSFDSLKPPQPVPDPLERQVEPPTSRVTAPPPGKKIWTTSEVERFFADQRRGKYSAEESLRIEQDICDAPKEGRYRY